MSDRRARLWLVFVSGLLLAAALGQPAIAEPSPDAAAFLAEAPDSLRIWLHGLDEGQRELAVSRLARLPAARRARLFRRFDHTTAADRARLLRRIEAAGPPQGRRSRGVPPAGVDRQALRDRLESMSPAERREFRRRARKWKGLGAERQARLRKRLRRFRELDATSQEGMIDRRFPDLDAEARERMLEGLRTAADALPPASGLR